MTLSIIIVHYKTPALLGECLISLERAVAGIAHEVIVIDNSADAGELPRSVRVVNPGKNVGYAAGANLGMALAKGEFLLFLNPDTFVQADAIRAMLHAARVMDGFGCGGPRLITPRGVAISAFPALRPFEARWWPLVRRLRSIAPSMRINRYQSICQSATEWTSIDGNLSGAALLIPSWVARKIGPRDLRFNHFGEEHHWQGQIAALGLKRVFIPQAEVFHWEAASVAADPQRVKSEVRLSRKLFYD